MRCVRIDFRGHGASSRCRSYELEALVSDVTAVISAISTDPPVVVGHSLGGLVATIAATMGITGPVICVDQPLNLEGFAEVVHPLAARLRDPATYPDALMEEKLALGMGLVPEPIFGELERKTRTSDQNVWSPMLEWDLDAMDAAKHEPLSRVGFFLFAETLRAWVGQSRTEPMSLGAWPLIRAEPHRRPISNDTLAGLQSQIAVLYESPRAQRFGRYDQRCP